MKFRKFMYALPFVGASAFATEVTGSYTMPQGVEQALADAKVAGTTLANAAIPVVAGVALAFVGISLVWLAIRAIRRAAK